MSARARRLPLLALVPSLVLLAACSLNHTQSALEPAGPQARHLADLWDFALRASVVVYVLTLLGLGFAVLHRRRRAASATAVLETTPETDRRMRRWVGVATAATVAVLLAYLVVDLLTGRALGAIEQPKALVVRVTGRQWWWQVEYQDSATSRTVLTANEIHIPVGRPVMIETVSGDVIHSFWVPNLHGKRDHVPGLHNRLWLQADRAGVYRGECAEFCGLQHAKMAFDVVAEPPAQFARWYAQQLSDAALPGDSLRAHGMQTFMGKPCAMCHTIRGTPAGGRVGPDLTHLASRRTLAAGTLPNTRGHLAGWILDPQSLKPGTQMPSNNLTPDELHAVLAYLEGLK